MYYNVILRGVSVTIIVVEKKQKVLNIISVCVI